jgi:alpha-glucuronidase
VDLDLKQFTVNVGSSTDSAMTLAVSLFKERAEKAAAPARDLGGRSKITVILGKFEEELILSADRRLGRDLRSVVLPPDGYVIRMRESGAETIIVAAGQTGRAVFYAAGTLLQQIGVENGKPGIRMADINDWPEWSHRFLSDYGLHVKDICLMMALHKLNGFAVQHRHASRNQPMFNITSEEDIAQLAARCKWAAANGISHIMICTDDWTPYENGR